MRLEDDIDFTTLNWVKQELDDTLRQARQALEAYVEQPSDQSQLRFCASFLHQVQGTLRMVELYGAAMVVEEMERLVQSLLDDEIRRRDDSYSVLMRGMVQMPDYLERLQGGHKDIPIVLLPLLNDLRACRGEKLLSESVLFAPDLGATLPASAVGLLQPAADAEIRPQATRLRTRYQSGLLAWIKNENSEPAISGLIETLDELRAISFDPETRRLWWIAAGLLDAARQRAVDIGSAVKLLFGKVDREIKRMADGGEQALVAEPPRELTQNLLYYLAHGAASGERVDAIRATYRLDELLPTQAELEHAKGSIGGKNRALLDTVSAAIKEDLLRVKDALDLYLRRGDAVPAELSGQAAVLDRVADTLGMLGLGVPRRVVQEQRRVLDDLASGARIASEASLLDVAGALLYVEVSLDENIRTLGVSGAEADSQAPVSVTDPTALPKAEVKRILDALLRESIANVQRAKSDIVAYIESGWQGERLHTLPTALEEIVGAMRMLDQQETADLVRALSRFVEVELVGEGRVPTNAQVEHLADAFTSIEYYLEATGESRSGREQILDVTRESLAALGYWPPPSAEELRERDVAAEDWSAAAAARTEAANDAPAMVAEAVEATAPVVVESTGVQDFAHVDADAAPVVEGFETLDSRYAEDEVAADIESPATQDASGEGSDFPLDADTNAAEWSAAASDLAEAFPEPPLAAERGEAASGETDFALRDDGSEWPEIGDSPIFTTEVLGQSQALVAGSDGNAADPVEGADGLIDIAELPSAGFDESLRTLEADLGRSGEPVQVAPTIAESTPGAESGDVGYEWIEVEEEVEEDIDLSDLPGDSLPGGFDASAGEDIDDDIREVFIEEVTEEITNIGRMLPPLRANPDDVEAMRNVRRSFHTLKGSGRLVGALALGEFSWRVETMLNRVLDRSIPMDLQVIAVLEHSRVALDQLRTELRGMGAATALPRLVMQAADHLVAGEPGTIETTRRVMRKRSVRVPVAVPVAPVVVPVEAQAAEQEVAAAEVQAAMEEAELLAAGIEEPEVAAAIETTTGERMPEIEPMLLEVLRSEAGGYLVALEGWIEQARDSGNRLVPTAELLRAVHTLHGALGMVEVPVVAEVVGMLEGYLKRLVGAGRTPSAEGLEAMADVSGVVGATLALLDRPGASVPPAGDLNDRLAALRDDLPELASPTIPSWVDADEDEQAVVADDAVAVAPIEAEIESLAAQSPEEEAAPAYEFDAIAAREFADAGDDLAGIAAAFEREVEVGSALDAPASGAFAEPDEGDVLDEPLAAELLGDVPAMDWDLPQPAYIEPEVVEHAETEFDSQLLDELAALGGDTLPSIEPDEDVAAVEAPETSPAVDEEAAFAEGVVEPAIEEFDEPAMAESDVPVEAAFEQPLVDEDVAAPGMPEATEGAELAIAAELEEVTAAAESPVIADEEPTEAAPLSAAEHRRQKRKSARQSKREQRAADLGEGAEEAAQVSPVIESTEQQPAPEFVEELEEAASYAADIEIEPDFAEPLPIAAAAEAAESVVEPEPEALQPTAAAVETTDSVIESDFSAPLPMAAGSDGEWQDEVDPDRPLVLPDLDADLLEIFVEEGREILDQADPVLAQLRDDAHSASAISAIQRHLHTIKGNARAVGLFGIGDVSHALETLIDSPHGRTAGAVELVQRGFDRLHRMVSRVGAGRDLAYPARLIAMLEASASGVPMPLAPATAAPHVETPPAPVVIDAATAHDRLALEEDLAPWREPEAIVEPAAEQMEPLEDEAAFAASDAMVAAFPDDSAEAPVAIEEEGTAEFDADDRARIEQDFAPPVDFDEMAAAAELDVVTDRGEAPAEPAAEVTAPEPEPEPALAAAPVLELPAAVTNVVRLDDYRLPAQVIATDEAAQRQSQELIRVRADLLDSLVNYAGEVSIYRSRLEQQLGAFRTNVGELEQTVERTREQLRKLDIETEAQIIARFQREAEDDQGTFDPLELDRFSNLQQLSRALAESVSDLVSLHGTLDDLARQQETLLLQQSRVASELQQGLMRTRMVPFETQVPFLRRLVRQSADELGKRAQLYVDGAQGEMDRNLLERMKAPLEHMLRNALAHGIEAPAERSAQGKAGEGNVRIEVAREASEVLIRVSDDGRGLDREAIRRKAIERGLMRADSTLTDRDLFGFITETGFSTADTVSKLAGRGVGMDVVANEIRELGGSLSIDSEQNQGSRFTIRLPFTLAVTQAIMVRLGEAIFAVPMSSVQGVARLPLADFDQRIAGTDTRLLSYGGEEYAVHDLALLLGTEPNRVVDTAGQLPLLLVRSGDQRAAIRVDSVVGSREIVVKSTGSQIASVPGMFGATIMGDGSVVMILDLAPLVRRHIAQRAERAVADELAAMLPGGLEMAPQAVFAEPAKVHVKRQLLVMVVDDSITMRKVTSRVLERNDMEVVTAKDGVDAVEKLQERVPDLAILDIEMPRMDGYELATYIRNDPRLRHLPLMMITSRTGDKHRQRAFEIGVDRFLGKPYQEADLLRTVFELIGDSPDA